MSKYKHLLRFVVFASLSMGVWHFGNVLWIYGKAYVATFLIDDAWQATLANPTSSHAASNSINKPWSWADTWPVAELSIPEIGLDEIVLSGDSGATLAFGPGLSNAGGTLESTHIKLISGHRDTHFSRLKNIAINDEIYIRTATGKKRYRVSDIKIVDSRSYTINPMDEAYDLALVTCYPFNAMLSGGHQRFVVQAEEINRS